MNEFEKEFDLPAPAVQVTDSPPATDENAADFPNETPAAEHVLPPDVASTVDPRRSAAGRLGGQRVHKLAELGREYEKEHGLTAGRQRLKQLIQLGRRYELEHGLRIAKPRRRAKGDAWKEFLTALSRIVKPVHRPAVEQLLAALQLGPKVSDPVPERAA